MFDLLHHVYLAAGNTNIATTAAGTNIKSFVTNTGAWLAGLGIPVGSGMFAYHAVMRNISGGDQQADAHHLSAMKKVVIGTIAVVGAGGVAHFAGGLM